MIPSSLGTEVAGSVLRTRSTSVVLRCRILDRIRRSGPIWCDGQDADEARAIRELKSDDLIRQNERGWWDVADRVGRGAPADEPSPGSPGATEDGASAARDAAHTQEAGMDIEALRQAWSEDHPGARQRPSDHLLLVTAYLGEHPWSSAAKVDAGIGTVHGSRQTTSSLLSKRARDGHLARRERRLESGMIWEYALAAEAAAPAEAPESLAQWAAVDDATHGLEEDVARLRRRQQIARARVATLEDERDEIERQRALADRTLRALSAALDVLESLQDGGEE